MGIDNLFDAGDTPYIVNETVNDPVHSVAGRMIQQFFDRPGETGLIWAFYQTGFRNWTDIKDGIRIDNAGTLRGSREENFTIFDIFKSTGQFVSHPSDYLGGVDAVYLQFCSSDADLHAIGIERTRQGTEIGRYDFQQPVN